MAEEGEEKKSAAESEESRSWPCIFLCIFGAFASFYLFLLGLQLLGDSFKCLAGKGAGNMFAVISNPIAGLMTGILATVMVQSSSTSTSIVVGLVGAAELEVKTAIPVIMGANIGTSVTNTIVSMGQSGDRLMLERAFSGATVHDMFNYLTVATLLPLEIIVAAIQGEGGPLYWLTYAITDAAVGGNEGGELFDSPIKAITKPVAALFIKNNKYIINALTLDPPVEYDSEDTNQTVCNSRRLAALPDEADDAGEGAGSSEGSRSLLSRRMEDNDGKIDCSHYQCTSKDLAKNFGKISKDSYAEKVVECAGYVSKTKCLDKQVCLVGATKFHKEYVMEKQIIKGGFTKGMGDVGGGIVALIFALLFLCGGLFFLCKCLSILLLGKAKRVIAKATKLPGVLSLVIGLVMTIIVQSSSVVTSALVPFCGVGVLPLEKMLPLTLGANIGTTVTALITALADLKFNKLHIALCHLFFNIFGILIWYPIPLMRRIPLGAARLLGLYASYYRFVPIVYILIAFVLFPGIALGVSALFDASIAGGIVLLLVLLLALGAFEFWWWKMGCYKVLSQEQREQGEKELTDANAEILGDQI